jgi:hypothetical protein
MFRRCFFVCHVIYIVNKVAKSFEQGTDRTKLGKSCSTLMVVLAKKEAGPSLARRHKVLNNLVQMSIVVLIKKKHEHDW